MAVPSNLALVYSVGSLKIPKRTGILKIDNVYFCKGICGTIFLSGRLVSDGWQLEHKEKGLFLYDCSSRKFETFF